MSQRRSQLIRDIDTIVEYGHRQILRHREGPDDLWLAYFVGGTQLSVCASAASFQLDKRIGKAESATIGEKDHKALLRRLPNTGAARCHVLNYAGPEIAAKILTSLHESLNGNATTTIAHMLDFVAGKVRATGSVDTLDTRCFGGNRIYPAAAVAIALATWQPTERKAELDRLSAFLCREFDRASGEWQPADHGRPDLAVNSAAFVALRLMGTGQSLLRPAARAIAAAVTKDLSGQFYEEKLGKNASDTYVPLKLNRYAWAAEALFMMRGLIPEPERKKALVALARRLLDRYLPMSASNGNPGRELPGQESIEEFARDMIALWTIRQELSHRFGRRFLAWRFASWKRLPPKKERKPVGTEVDREQQMLNWTKASVILGAAIGAAGILIALFLG